jgi:hypothetical protein
MLQELSDYFLGLEEIEQQERNRQTTNNRNNRNRSPSSSSATNSRGNSNGNQGNNNPSSNNSNNNNNSPACRNARNYCHCHGTDRHSWYDCRLNPRSDNYDPNQPPPISERNHDNTNDTASTSNSRSSQSRHSSTNHQSNQRDARDSDNSNRPRHSYNTRSNTRSNEGNYHIQDRPQRANANRYATSLDDNSDDSLYAMEEK